MSGEDSTRDKAVRVFIQECAELLAEMEMGLLRLEKSPGDTETLNAVFRAVHTVKGASGVVGLDDVETFAHGVENVLDRLRDGDIELTSDLTALLIASHDIIKTLVESSSAAGGLPPAITSERERMAKSFAAYCPSEKPCEFVPEAEAAPTGNPLARRASTTSYHISLRFGRDIMRHGLDPAGFLGYLTKLGEIVSITALLDAMPPAATMDPEACYLGLELDFSSMRDRAEIDEVFDFLREDCSVRIIPPESAVAEYLRLIQELPEENERLGDVFIKGGALTEREFREGMRALEAGLTEESAVAGGQQEAQPSTAAERGTVRVDTERLDRLVNAVGEIVITASAVRQHAERLEDSQLLSASSVLGKLVEVIRDSAMGLRMVPLADTFGRYYRVVRDASRETGKEAELIVEGGETEIDRNVADAIRDPLMHLVRNAVDHGIEPPDERVSRGKLRRGIIRLSATHAGGSVVIDVSDDGRGLDMKSVLAKSRAMGLAGASEELSDAELTQMLFRPGFSTAPDVTRLSGRGVGLDVVKSNIESLRGTVEVMSTAGSGTTVRITLPLTLAIVEGFLVEIGGRGFVVNMDAVVECMLLQRSERAALKLRDHINVRGKALPFLRLRDVLGVVGAEPRFEHVLVVRHEDRRVGLLVDELMGQIQAVVKPLGKLYSDVRGVSGATILGNGSVALILDVPALVGIALDESAERIAASKEASLRVSEYPEEDAPAA